MAEAIAALSIVAFVATVVGFVKRLQAGDSWGVLSQILAWAVGIGAAFLWAAGLPGAVTVGDVTLGKGMSPATIIVVGLAIGSLAMKYHDAEKVFDNNQSAAEPRLGARPARTT